MSKVVVIVGATGGIGKATTEVLAKDSEYDVVLVGRNQNALNHLSSELFLAMPSIGKERPLAYSMNIFDDEDVKNTFQKIIAQKGQIDALIITVGIFLSGTQEISPTAMKKMFLVNYWGPVYCLQAAAEIMQKQAHGGKIIVLSSRAAHLPRANFGAYAATKAALTAFCNALNQQCIQNKVTVSTVSPGAVDTPMSFKSGLPDDVKIPPKDIVSTLIYLLKLSNKSLPGDIVIHTEADMLGGQYFKLFAADIEESEENNKSDTACKRVSKL